MEDNSYIFFLLGLMFCFSQIYLYFRREILKRIKTNIKYYDSMCCILLGLFTLNILTLFSVLFSITSFIIFFSWLDWILYKNNPQHQLWWCYLTKCNYFYLGVIIFISVCLFYNTYHLDGYIVTLCIFFILSFGFFWKRIKYQKKIGLLMESRNIWSKIINWIGKFIHNIFYYTYQAGVIVIVLFLLFRIILLPVIDPLDVDSCLDGYFCKEGNSFDDCGDGKPCVITKEYCLEHNYKWIEQLRSCDMNRKATNSNNTIQ